MSKLTLFCASILIILQLAASNVLQSTNIEDVLPGNNQNQENEVYFEIGKLPNTCHCYRDGNGICKKDDKTGKEECVCRPGYGVFESGTGVVKELICKECNCGKVIENGKLNHVFDCKFSLSLWTFVKKECICNVAGYYKEKEQCTACDCGQRYDGTLFNCTRSRSCDCSTGYKQTNNKCKAADVCRLKPCLNNGSCKTVINDDEDGFKCECKTGFKGKLCEDRELNPCDNNPCQNEGVCEKVDLTQYRCRCRSPYTGKNCETELNPCGSNPCRNGGICEKLNPIQYKCTCLQTHTGRNCETEMDPCNKNPCANGGACVKINATDFKCYCSFGYTGRICQDEIDPCDNKPCTNGGICEKISPVDYTCHCFPPYAGKDCEIEIDPCDSQPCVNGGICKKTTDSDFLCNCPSTYTGKNCETESETTLEDTTIIGTTENELRTLKSTTTISTSTASPSEKPTIQKINIDTDEYKGIVVEVQPKSVLLQYFKMKKQKIEILNLNFKDSNKESN